MNNIPIYYIESGSLTGLSLVEHPAIEEEVLLFSKAEPLKFSFNEEKKIAFGPALIADKPIYRIDPDGREYFVVFTKDVIEKLVVKWGKEKTHLFNLEHKLPTDKVYIVESFISREGIQPIGFECVALGSWFVSLKVEDDNIWSDLKSGKYNGFSIECLVDLDVPTFDPIDEIVNSVLS